MIPSLFIFLIDQSTSMRGERMKIASKALIIFLQSLPAGSYYQIIGFNSKFIIYDEIPKKYNKENIERNLNIIKNISANNHGTNFF